MDLLEKMDVLEDFFGKSDFSLGENINNEGTAFLIEKAIKLDFSNSEHRKEFIKNVELEFEHFYLKNWENHFNYHENMDDNLWEKIEAVFKSVAIIYKNKEHCFFYEFDEEYFDQIYPIATRLQDEDEVLEFISPTWSLSTIFMSEEGKEVEAEQLLIREVKKVVNKTKLLEKLYTELPDLFNELIDN
ncbi:hypothetical protein MZM54_04100 [[Brevibacterium] frigoritolerans]|nr:hypothetical protein [Peribacillus frigoritolerans]